MAARSRNDQHVAGDTPQSDAAHDPRAFSPRYTRQISLPEIGADGQSRLLGSSVLVIGAGGLGSPAIMYLAAAGVGRIGIMDGDTVDAGNLQRQIVHTTPDIGRPKAISAAETVTALNPDVEVVAYDRRLEPDGAQATIAAYDFVIDATDNFSTKFLIADACDAAATPYSHAGIQAFRGQTMTVIPGQSACYRCIFEMPPPETGEPPRGPLGVVPAVIGSIQAAEAIKQITGVGNLLTNRLFTFDALSMRCREIALQRNPHCTLCGEK